MLDIDDLVNAHLYEDRDAVIRDALRHLLRARPDLRVRMAVHRYETEDISLAAAASTAGVSWDQMRDILTELGIPARLGSATLDEARAEVRALREHLEPER